MYKIEGLIMLGSDISYNCSTCSICTFCKVPPVRIPHCRSHLNDSEGKIYRRYVKAGLLTYWFGPNMDQRHTVLVVDPCIS